MSPRLCDAPFASLAAIPLSGSTPTAVQRRLGVHPDELPDQFEAIVAAQSESNIRVHVGSMDGLEGDSLSHEVRSKVFFETGLVLPPPR
jgi:hypothetical protein